MQLIYIHRIIIYLTYICSDNLTPPISRVLIGRDLKFCSRRYQCAATRLENVRQLNISRDKKLGFQLSQKHPLYKEHVRTLNSKKLKISHILILKAHPHWRFQSSLAL